MLRVSGWGAARAGRAHAELQGWAGLLHLWQLLPTPDTHPSFYRGYFPWAFFPLCSFHLSSDLCTAPNSFTSLLTAVPFPESQCWQPSLPQGSSAPVTSWCPFCDGSHLRCELQEPQHRFVGQCSFELGSCAWGCSSLVLLGADRSFLLGSSSFVSLNVAQIEWCAWFAARETKCD